MTKELTLGLDVGTTKVAASLVDPQSRCVVDTYSLNHQAEYLNHSVSGSSEQSTHKIFEAVCTAVRGLDSVARAQVKAIGITGQMHGVVLCNKSSWESSNLVTWKDQRSVHDKSLSEFRAVTGHSDMQSGFGLATMAWWAKYNPRIFDKFPSACSIHGFVAGRLCNTYGGMDPSDAASFGLFDIERGDWNYSAVQKCGVDPAVLPKIVRAPENFGVLTEYWATALGLSKNTPVMVPIGDNQASVFASIIDPSTQISLTIGTGAQISAVVSDYCEMSQLEGQTSEIRPFFDSSFLVTGASLSGGRTLAVFVELLFDFFNRVLTDNVPEKETLYATLIELAEAKIKTDLESKVHFSGERFSPLARGSITNISYENFTAGDVFASLNKGLVATLKEMLPGEIYAGKLEIIGSGNAVRRSTLLQRIIEQEFNLRFLLTDFEEPTCVGAALLAGRLLG